MYSPDYVTATAIIDRIKADLKNPANRIEGSFASDNAQAVGKEIARYYTYMEWLSEMRYASTATGEYLENIAGEVGIFRKQSTYATGYVAVSGSPGAYIPNGMEVTTSRGVAFVVQGPYSGDGIDFGEDIVVPTEMRIPESGELRLAVTAKEAGSGGNVPAESIMVPSELTGILSITNPEPTSGGGDWETDDLLRDRTLLRMRYPGTSGNQYHYLTWALEVPGVGRAKVFPEWNGPGTVKVSVLDSGYGKASESLVRAVQTHIDPEPRTGEGLAPIGAYLTVSTASEVDYSLQAEVVLGSGSQRPLSEIEDEVKAKIQEYLDSIAFTDRTIVTVARLIDIIWSVDGVEDIGPVQFKHMRSGDWENIPSSDKLGSEEVGVIRQVVISQ